MTNFKLNFGGVVGAVICLAAAAAVLYVLANNGGFPRRGAKVVIFAAIGGAALGNWIWNWALPSDTPKT
jgi:hypothetical protein